MKLQVKVEKQLSDVYTPVGIYLNLRKVYKRTVLLEGNERTNAENCRSFIGLEPMARKE